MTQRVKPHINVGPISHCGSISCSVMERQRARGVGGCVLSVQARVAKLGKPSGSSYTRQSVKLLPGQSKTVSVGTSHVHQGPLAMQVYRE